VGLEREGGRIAQGGARQEQFMRRRCVFALGSLASVALLSACHKSGKPDMVWQSQLYRPHSYERMMVIAIDDNPRDRLALEQAVVDYLNKEGAAATPSSNLIRDLGRVDVDGFMNFLRSDGIQSVVTIEPFATVAAVEETDWDVQESPDLRTVAGVGWTTTTIVGDFGIEVIVFDVKSGRAVWAARSDIFEAETETDEVAAFVGETVSRHVR
jgi:hypothetical protein